ncbi:nuclear transport factor 2 family protein [Dactylosporangium matsuzakiense]|nr:nuclear transport factor 2 family protein [Dactylosporangium matsuzakiense]
MRATPLADLVRTYYDNIDAGDVPAALACFASTAVYRRPGYPALVGRAAIEAFYAATRVVGPGRHSIEVTVEDGDEVAVRGRFDGTRTSGEALNVRWADFWRVADGRVVERNSYFDAPVA